MSVDHSHDPDPIEQLLLTAYPNPERKGCSGRAVLESLANQERDENDPNWYHIWHCSPCYAEFKELRDARWEREKLQAQRRKWAVWGAVAAACIAAIVFFSLRANRRPTPPQLTSITINLFNVETQRGAGQETKIELPPLPRTIDNVRIILPRFSQAGMYTVAILRSKQSGSALALAKSQTVANGQQLVLHVQLDLANAPAGNYLLGTRLDEGDLIYYYPLKVK